MKENEYNYFLNNKSNAISLKQLGKINGINLSEGKRVQLLSLTLTIKDL